MTRSVSGVLSIPSPVKSSLVGLMVMNSEASKLSIAGLLIERLSPVSMKADAFREFCCTSARQFLEEGDSLVLAAFEVRVFLTLIGSGDAKLRILFFGVS